MSSTALLAAEDNPFYSLTLGISVENHRIESETQIRVNPGSYKHHR